MEEMASLEGHLCKFQHRLALMHLFHKVCFVFELFKCKKKNPFTSTDLQKVCKTLGRQALG